MGIIQKTSQNVDVTDALMQTKDAGAPCALRGDGEVIHGDTVFARRHLAAVSDINAVSVSAERLDAAVFNVDGDSAGGFATG